MTERSTTNPQLTTRECEELNVWSDVVGWETDYRQLGKGKFDAWFNMSVCWDLRVVDQYCSREIIVTGIPPASHVALVIPLNGGDRGVFQGKALGPDEVAVMGPSSVGIYRTPADLRLLTLTMPISRLGEALQATCDRELDPLVCETRIIELSPERMKRFVSIARQVLGAAPGVSRDAAPAIWRGELEARFVTSLMDGLTGGEKSEPGRLARMSRVGYVTAARDYIDANLHNAIGVEKLARATGVSPRTLEYAFRDVCGTSPQQYIKTCRLHAARRRLLDVEDPATTVTEVALANGFNHFGYFARDYHELFAEHPSTTLAKRGRRSS